MRLGIDYVSLIIFVAAYAFSQVKAVPVKIRYGVVAAAFAGIALYRLRIGAQGPNLIFVLVAAAFAVYYLVRAFRTPSA